MGGCRFVRYDLTLFFTTVPHSHSYMYIQDCQGRLVAVCEFYNFVRHIRQGLYSTRKIEDLYFEVLVLKRKMFYARVRALHLVGASRPFVAGTARPVSSSSLREGGGMHALLRPDSQLLSLLELDESLGKSK
jgi:hypothetical protein